MDFEDDWRLLRPGDLSRSTLVGVNLMVASSWFRSDSRRIVRRVFTRSIRETTWLITARLALSGVYGGSGPAQLSFALLLNYLGEKQLDQVQKTYQHFKFAVIAGLESSWTLHQDQIQQILDGL